MSHVISILSQKGGVGKSTVTTLLANVFYFHFNVPICVIDADHPQHSIMKRRNKEKDLVSKNPRLKNAYDNIYHEREPYPIIKTKMENCVNLIEEMKSKYRVIFVDVAGTINNEHFINFLNAVNHFFIPVLQDDFSSKSAVEVFQIIDLIKSHSKNFVSSHYFFNRVPANNIMRLIKSELGNSEYCMDDYLSAYSVYERSFRSTIFPIPKKDDKPSSKLFGFSESILKVLTSKQMATTN